MATASEGFPDAPGIIIDHLDTPWLPAILDVHNPMNSPRHIERQESMPPEDGEVIAPDAHLPLDQETGESCRYKLHREIT